MDHMFALLLQTYLAAYTYLGQDTHVQASLLPGF